MQTLHNPKTPHNFLLATPCSFLYYYKSMLAKLNMLHSEKERGKNYSQLMFIVRLIRLWGWNYNRLFLSKTKVMKMWEVLVKHVVLVNYMSGTNLTNYAKRDS